MSRRSNYKYSQLATGEAGDKPVLSKPRSRMARVNNILHTLMWMAGAAFILYYGDVYRVIMTDYRLNRTFLNLGGVLVVAQVALFVYMTVYLPLTADREIKDYNEYCPRAVMAAMLNTFAIFITLSVAIWPVWGFVSPIMLAVCLIALVFSTNLLPSWC